MVEPKTRSFFRFEGQPSEIYMNETAPKGSLGPCGAGMVTFLYMSELGAGEVTEACGSPSEGFVWAYVQERKFRIPVCMEHLRTIENDPEWVAP